MNLNSIKNYNSYIIILNIFLYKEKMNSLIPEEKLIQNQRNNYSIKKTICELLDNIHKNIIDDIEEKIQVDKNKIIFNKNSL
jgi:hypothetical protein